MPCTPADGPEGWNPRREEISTRTQSWKGDGWSGRVVRAKYVPKLA